MHCKVHLNFKDLQYHPNTDQVIDPSRLEEFPYYSHIHVYNLSTQFAWRNAETETYVSNSSLLSTSIMPTSPSCAPLRTSVKVYRKYMLNLVSGIQ